MGFLSTSVAVLAAVSLSRALSTCASTGSSAQYDYIVVGAGAGGGPVAARLAEAGFSGKRLSECSYCNTTNNYSQYW